MAWKCYSVFKILSLAFAALILIFHFGTQRRYFIRKCETSRSEKCAECRKDSNSTPAARWESVQKRLAWRHENLINVCKEKYPSNESDDLSIAYVKNRFLKTALFFSNKYKILFCQIPKCGTRSQARFLAGIDELVKPADVPTMSEGKATSLIERHLSARRANSLGDIVKKIQEYTKVIIVREPLSRLLSAFRNKLEHNARNDQYANLASQLHTKYGNGSGEQVEGAPVISIDDFLSYLTEEPGSQNDQHWNFYHRLCSPCTIGYDYIIRMSTIDEDMEYIKSRFGITVPFPRSYDSFTDNLKVHQYFTKANPLLVNKIFHTYQLDFDLFGFPPPPQF